MPVVFVQGNGVDHRLLLDLDDVFEADGRFERFHLDLPGFGQTSPLDGLGGLPEIADWLDEVIGEQVGSRPFLLVACSLGGLLAREVVRRRSDQCAGFAILAPVVDSVRENRRVPEHVVLEEEPGLLATIPPEHVELFAPLAVIRTRATWERFASAALPGLLAADAEAMERLDQRYSLEELPDEAIDGYDRPVLIVAGRQDAVVGWQDQVELARRFPRATVAVLDRTGHNTHLERPALVRALLTDWLTAIEAG
ncbi:alpha/beta hydrolase [Aeromicrobium alkaliterrae]|uniref:Alpha/beta hydrolase n=2 Tax=Aeromicrobium alkaliterrae TaxID=302168 RepID=A0ABN2JGG4_9ACTN